ncbi:AI-2E family transporter [Christensenella tenuis]|uniref:AI-2E family transporter n=1 Tax=Christensenella tenuis TaxID=2763033 RepID=A0ABR7ECZ8_9FIRM|nr:AI-2E family transporter [Christensenella tenuis]MBC5646914.1 AI-2E family transporter [Christensenella tenuis]
MKVEWNKKYTTIAVYTIIVAAIVTMIVLFFLNIQFFGSAIAAFFMILMPFIVGFCIAYLLVRPCRFVEKHWFSFIERRRPHPRLRRSLSIFIVIMIAFAIFALLIYFIIPQVVASLTMLFNNIPMYLDELQGSVVGLLQSWNLYTPEVAEQIANLRSTLLDLTSFFDKLIESLPSMLTSVGTGLFNFFVGLIVSIYVVFAREKFKRQAKKLTYALFTPGFADKFLDVLRYSNNVFLGFINGTLIDAAFVGITTFIFMTVCGLPYALLIAVIIGCTNIIPFFGPFLGAIPSAVILLIVDPLYALIFVIFILILQQIDGNIVMPKIVGLNIGMSAFWVLFALILFGGLFGFWGMLLGVPVFTIIYSLIKTCINRSLEKKGIPPQKYSYPKDIIEKNGGKKKRKTERQSNNKS